MNLSVLSNYVDELNKHGIEVWGCFDPDLNIIRIKVKKGNVCFEDSFEYTGFCRELLLRQMIRDLVNKVEKRYERRERSLIFNEPYQKELDMG